MDIELKPGLYQCSTFLKSNDGTIDHAYIDQVSILSMDDKPKTKPKINMTGELYISCYVLGFMLPEGNRGANIATIARLPDKAVIQENDGFFIHAKFQNLYSPVYTFTDSYNKIIGITIPIK